jgi:ribosomal protein S25
MPLKIFFAFGLIGFFGMVIFLTIYLVYAYYKSIAAQTKYRFSDRDIFILLARANHFLTPKQLSALSPLNEKEAKARLMHLYMEGALRQYTNGSGTTVVYQLREALPTSEQLPISLQGLSDDKIIRIIEEYSEDYQVTVAELVLIFGIDIYEAKILIKRLKKTGFLTRLLSSKGFIYVIKNPILQNKPKTRHSEVSNTPKIPLQNLTPRIKIPDATMIDLAIKHKGNLTPALVCVKLNISLQEAKQKLEELQNQGVFLLDINPENHLIEYQLRDKNLL